MTFGEKIRNARKIKGLTQKQLADKIGAKHNSISDWENDKNKPDPDTIELICGILEMTPNYLLDRVYDCETSPFELDIIKKYRSLDEHGKRIVDLILNEEYNRIEDSVDFISLLYFPRLVSSSPDAMSDSYSEFINIPIRKAHQKADYVVRVNSMEMFPIYESGDKLFVQKCSNLNMGDTGLFLLNKSCILRTLDIDERLISGNSASSILKLSSNIICTGKILGKLE